MAEHSGHAGEALTSARAALSARDGELARADRELADTVAAAHAVATGAIRRLDAVAAEIESAVAHEPVESTLEAHEFARFLIAKQREVIDIVTEARAAADARAVELRQLLDSYRVPAAR